MYKIALLCALGALVSACASTSTPATGEAATEVREEREYRTGSLLPRREPASNVKVIDKDQMQNAAKPAQVPAGTGR